MTGAGSMNFTAPTVSHTTVLTGYKNMLYWQSETCKNSAYGNASNPRFDWQGTSNGAATATGLIYMPYAQLNVQGGGNFGNVQIIVGSFVQGGSQAITIRYNRFIDTDTQKYGLVE
jgi:hypothetical protein